MHHVMHGTANPSSGPLRRTRLAVAKPRRIEASRRGIIDGALVETQT